MLSKSWDQRKPAYDFVVVGSGYGGAITAARIAQSSSNGSPSVCILERGREWPVGDFPDRLDEVIGEQRSSANPLGLFELLNYRDISVMKGSGLGGTSLINANVAIVPDEEVFESASWPAVRATGVVGNNIYIYVHIYIYIYVYIHNVYMYIYIYVGKTFIGCVFVC